MRIEVRRDAAGVGDAAADAIAEVQPRVLGVATGPSPIPTYHALARRGAGDIERLLLLDEYIGLAPDHPERYRNVVLSTVGAWLDVSAEHVHGPDVDADDLDGAADAYEAKVIDARVDVQILGIGRNGHIGFNEPGTDFASRTRVVDLSDTTRGDNARFFDRPDDVPRRAITQGIATMLAARRIVLVATGASKASAVARLLRGQVDPSLPASALSTHPDTVVVVDDDAHHLIGVR